MCLRPGTPFPLIYGMVVYLLGRKRSVMFKTRLLELGSKGKDEL